jgi:chitin disaccharide deacetylase
MSRAPAVRFIVNADDLGATESINDAIFTGIAESVITSATIMATGPALRSAARRSQQFPRASFGVHMNLTTHRPLTTNAALAPLLDANGEFRRSGAYESKWSNSLVGAVAEEWIAQINAVRLAGVAVSHIDSHHHVHTRPGAFRALKRAQRATGIRRVRTTWSIYDRANAASWKLRAMKRVWHLALRHGYRTRTTDEFCDLSMFLRAVAEGSYAPRTWPGVIELMVHPTGDAQVDGDEPAILRSDWLRGLPVSGELVSYNAL